jgi:hypothetical protein
MNARELLECELWSKRTTWKILVVLILVLLLGYGIWQGYERYRISPGVRESGKAALAQIDALQELSTSCENASFRANAESADRKIRIANQKVHTLRDIDVMRQLSDYSESVRMRHVLICRQSSIGRLEGGSPSRDLDDRMLSRGAQLRQKLHKELD